MNFIKLTFLSLVLLLTGCPDEADSTDYKGTPNQQFQARSPKGVLVRSATPISAATLTAIDKGLDTAFRIAEAAPNNYSGFRKHAAYTVWLWPRSPKCENPAIYRQFETNSNGYDGTPYDKDPRKDKVGLCFAGISKPLGIGGSPNVQPQMTIVDDAGTIETVTQYEAEHNLLFEVDVTRYAATIRNDHFHPILGN